MNVGDDTATASDVGLFAKAGALRRTSERSLAGSAAQRLAGIQGATRG